MTTFQKENIHLKFFTTSSKKAAGPDSASSMRLELDFCKGDKACGHGKDVQVGQGAGVCCVHEYSEWWICIGCICKPYIHRYTEVGVRDGERSLQVQCLRETCK